MTAEAPALESPLTKLLETTWRTASRHIADDPKNEIHTLVTAQTEDGRCNFYLMPSGNDAGPVVAFELLKLKFKVDRVKRYTLISEVWMAAYPGSPDITSPDFKRPSERQDRMELLMAVGVDPEAGEVMQYLAQITRERDGVRILQERSEFLSGGRVRLDGRWFDLLGPVKPRPVH